MQAKILLVLYIVKQQKVIFFWRNKDYRKAKIIKRSHTYKSYVSTYNAEIRNKLKGLLTLLKGFKLVMTLVLEIKKRK